MLRKVNNLSQVIWKKINELRLKPKPSDLKSHVYQAFAPKVEVNLSFPGL